MQSMTGYGRARADTDGRSFTIELKSVNHRFLDINLRLPRGLLFLEDPIRKALSARLSRGHVDVFVTYQNTREDAREVVLDMPLMNAYINAFDRIAAFVDYQDDRSLTGLAMLPNVMTVSEREEDMDAVLQPCLQALHQALDSLIEMREREGKTLVDDTVMRLDRVERMTDQIATRAPDVVVEQKDRLNTRIAELLGMLPDPQRLAQEAALLADRVAIDEEITRLRSHIAQLRLALDANEPVGRKLDFLVQELHREINTIGAKASDLQVGTLVVEAKAEIEKIREQVQNIE